MRIDVTRQEFDCLIDSLASQLTKAQHKLRDELLRRLRFQLYGDAEISEKSKGWAPIRSGWPTAPRGGKRRTNWAFQRPRSPKQATAKKSPPTAQQILDSL